ncbi:MAG TPA: hypothetical protein VFJ85_11640 [Acidimicrobiales bacterium]|nr:hypothetical protein [Acidimicrobiales bacterium]
MADEGQDVASTVKGQAEEVGSRARQRTTEVAQATASEAKGLVEQVKYEASGVLEEATGQARRSLEDTRSVLQGQAASQLDRLSERLQQLAAEANALAEGNPEEAATLRDLVADAGQQLAGLAERVSIIGNDIETRGVGAALADVQAYARRRPGMFLLGAVGAGFLVGRIARSSSDDEDEYDEQLALPAGNGNGYRRASGSRRAR